MLKKILFAALVLTAIAVPLAPASAARVSVGIGIGGGYGGYGYYGPRYYGGYYPAYYGYYPGYYYAPPPTTVVYTQPSVVYSEPQPQPQQQVVYQAAPGSASAPVASDQSLPTYKDSKGRTCREYQASTPDSSQPPVYGTACLQPDGSWHVVK